jgi:hypothetical protein
LAGFNHSPDLIFTEQVFGGFGHGIPPWSPYRIDLFNPYCGMPVGNKPSVKPLEKRDEIPAGILFIGFSANPGVIQPRDPPVDIL